ncbi:MAG: creatininase family protein [Planctomycetota bacterium]
MTMQWEELTMPDFVKLRDETGVCLITVGCLERHGNHLPLGIDTLNAHAICRRAVEIEPAVIFPHYYFGQINEARCFPGTVALKPAMILEMLIAVIDEIGRNGFRKIIIVNGHGGNSEFLSFLLRDADNRRRDYIMYLFDIDRWYSADQKQARAKIIDNNFGGHAHEEETSIALANVEQLVKMNDLLPDSVGAENKRLADVMSATTKTSFNWYSMFPEHYSGNARLSTKAKGEQLMTWITENLARAIRVVKNDKGSEQIRDEFFKRENGIRSGK